ncbi:hypothetical protein H8Z59_27990 [Mycolicibacterium fortuitum]|uniref:hypothetical protein n=1 Tax=Mycolicibacterium fortuitum TaxID=1766 RepID=UPI001CDCE54F|nr:hypothetical protein [Mycolicibacterium fortuitum]UBV20991.1 hypothetical protein H8Z59_27990 [Mycolicibacterium fortuitum]
MPPAAYFTAPRIADARGINRVVKVNWFESHGQTIKELVFSGPLALTEQPSSDTTTVVVGVEYERPFDEETHWVAGLLLPKDASLAHCGTPTPGTLCPQPPGNPPTDSTNTDAVPLLYMGDVAHKGEKSVSLTFDVRTPTGLHFATSGPYTVARYPNVVLAGGEFPVNLDVDVNYAIQGADRLSWGTTPLTATDKSAFWSYTISHGKQEYGPAPNLGTDQSILNCDSTKTFYSGVLMGIGGGFFVAAVQTGWTRRRHRRLQ